MAHSQNGFGLLSPNLRVATMHPRSESLDKPLIISSPVQAPALNIAFSLSSHAHYYLSFQPAFECTLDIFLFTSKFFISASRRVSIHMNMKKCYQYIDQTIPMLLIKLIKSDKNTKRSKMFSTGESNI